MADLYVSWSDYHQSIERLAARVHESRWSFDGVVCIARGGLRVGDVIARIFKLPLAIIFTSSYVAEGGTQRGDITISEHLAMVVPTPGKRVLLVDDLVDSGVTLDVVKRHITAQHLSVEEIRTAVLWYKACSKVKPDFFADYLAESPWIHQPFEPYDLMSADDLGRRRS